MPFTTPGETWTSWSHDNAGADDHTKLAALRELIVRDARRWAASGEITPEWADKKLAKLGIADRLMTDNQYELTVTASGKFTMTILAANRTDAEAQFLAHLASISRATVAEPAAYSLPTFVSGPADPDPTAPVDPTIPTTVDQTLVALREIVMLAVIAGPHICVDGANDLLDDYGLAAIPARRKYRVSRPIVADMETTVEAYDMVSAARVANWRWDDNRKSFQLVDADPTGGDDKISEVVSA